jgi:haloacetate dehalogenase
MAALGFDTFAVAGHDRGGRVVHRMVLDHPTAVTRAAVLDIAPTRTMFEATDMSFALTNYHWFFLAQPYDLPERMIAADPDAYLRHRLGRAGNIADVYHPDAVAEYARAFADPQVIHASCEDYRAAATIDLDHDRADDDARIACPFLVLWGAHGPLERHFDVLATWRDKAAGPMTGKALDCGHFLAEERPDEVASELIAFLATTDDR